MKIRYRIVDIEGDEFNLSYFTNGGEIPVRMKCVRILHDAEPDTEPEMEITLQYLHGYTPM